MTFLLFHLFILQGPTKMRPVPNVPTSNLPCTLFPVTHSSASIITPSRNTQLRQQSRSTNVNLDSKESKKIGNKFPTSTAKPGPISRPMSSFVSLPSKQKQARYSLVNPFLLESFTSEEEVSDTEKGIDVLVCSAPEGVPAFNSPSSVITAATTFSHVSHPTLIPPPRQSTTFVTPSLGAIFSVASSRIPKISVPSNTNILNLPAPNAVLSESPRKQIILSTIQSHDPLSLSKGITNQQLSASENSLTSNFQSEMKFDSFDYPEMENVIESDFDTLYQSRNVSSHKGASVTVASGPLSISFTNPHLPSYNSSVTAATSLTSPQSVVPRSNKVDSSCECR